MSRIPQDTSHNLGGQKGYYQPLIEALTEWQGLFEIALDTAAQHLTPEQLPTSELQASLSEMCDLLREVLRQSQAQEG